MNRTDSSRVACRNLAPGRLPLVDLFDVDPLPADQPLSMAIPHRSHDRAESGKAIQVTASCK